MSVLLGQIRKDANFKKFRLVFERTQERVDLQAGLQEALTLHAGRSSRKLYGKDQFSLKALVDASLKDLSFRSRMVEIRVQSSTQLSILREAVRSIRKYLSTEYADDLREFSTAEQRKNFVDRTIKSALAFLEEGDSLIDTLDHLIGDIDKASFHLRNMMECLKLLSEGKGHRPS